MTPSVLGPLSGFFAGVPAALAGALSGAPWWAVTTTFFGVSLVLATATDPPPGSLPPAAADAVGTSADVSSKGGRFSRCRPGRVRDLPLERSDYPVNHANRPYVSKALQRPCVYRWKASTAIRYANLPAPTAAEANGAVVRTGRGPYVGDLSRHMP